MASKCFSLFLLIRIKVLLVATVATEVTSRDMF